MPSVLIKTYGCQMNERDSEQVASMFLSGGYELTKDEAEADVQAQANADAAEVIEDLTDAEVTLTTTPGLYYSFEYGTTLENMTEGARTLATGDSLDLARPTTQNATSDFYRVLVNITDK